jgi:hypothetical protein
LSTALDLCDWDSWERYQAMLEDTSRQLGNAIAFGRCFEGRATHGMMRGRTEDAARALGRLRPWLTRERSEEYYLFTSIQRAVIGSWRGEFQRAIGKVNSVHRRAREAGLSFIQAVASRHLADLFMISGQLDSARLHAESALRIRGNDVAVALPCLLVLSRIALREGKDASISALVDRVVASDAPASLACRQEIAAYTSLLGGDLQTAKDSSRLTTLQALDLAPREVLLEWEFGTALQSRGDADSRAYLLRALEISQRCSMSGWSGRISETLALESPAADTSAKLSFESRLLPRVIALMNSVVDFPSLLHQSLELAASAIGASRGFILLTGQSEFADAVAQFGGVDDGARASALEISRTIVRRVTESGLPFIAGDVGGSPAWFDA